MKIHIALGAIIFLASSTALACDYPDRPHIPDGSTATKEELLTAKNSVQTFFEGVDEYLRCIETKEKTAVAALKNPSEEDINKRDAEMNRTFDAANGEKAVVGELLNKQIRAYNAKRKQESAD